MTTPLYINHVSIQRVSSVSLRDRSVEISVDFDCFPFSEEDDSIYIVMCFNSFMVSFQRSKQWVFVRRLRRCGHEHRLTLLFDIMKFSP